MWQFRQERLLWQVDEVCRVVECVRQCRDQRSKSTSHNQSNKVFCLTKNFPEAEKTAIEKRLNKFINNKTMHAQKNKQNHIYTK